jgi:ribose 5-phosphate isomerase B
MRIAIGSDHRGHALRSKVIESIKRLGHEIDDLGTHNGDPVDYPDIASAVAAKVSNRQADLGILIGGTGIGMSVTANKSIRVRAAVCHDEVTAEMSRRHNDLNVLCLSADLLGESLTDRMVEVWLSTPFDRGHHVRRVEKIAALEQHVNHEKTQSEVEKQLTKDLNVRPQPMSALEVSDSERQRAEEALQKENCLLRELLDLQDKDRKLLACEIHDGLTQQIAGTLLQLQAFAEQWDGGSAEARATFHTALQTLGDCMHEARKLISGLHPPILSELGVVAAIDCLIGQTEERGGPDIEFVHRVLFDRLASPLEIAIFRIVQEAVTNACRHSQSKKTLVELVEQDSRVHIQIQDWGIGFDPQQVEEYRFGLRGIRERAELLGGQAAIDSSPGKGTRIIVELPLTSTIADAREKT